MIKFIYSEKATKFCEIFTLLLSYVVPVKSKVKISQNFVAFSEYMNFNRPTVTYIWNSVCEIKNILWFHENLEFEFRKSYGPIVKP